MSYARSPRGVSSTMYGIRVMAALLVIWCNRWVAIYHSNGATVELRIDRRSGMDAVEREVTVPATPGEVWPAVTQSDEVSAWFGADAQLEVRPGGRGVFRWR